MITLDAFGTLVELEPPVPLLIDELAARGIAVTAEQAGAGLAAEIAHYRAAHHAAGDAATLAELRDACTAVLGDALRVAGARLEGLGHDELRAALLAALRFRAYPEVPAALRAARGGGHALVVVSNWDVSLHEVLDRTGLRPLVDAVIVSAELGAAKPDGAIFAAALAAGGASAAETWHVGDSVSDDVGGARAAGLHAVLVHRAGAAPAVPDGVAVIRSLAGLRALGT